MHKRSTKKHWFVYYYDEDGHFRSEKVSFLQAMYYKKLKLRRLKYYCQSCGSFFVGLVKSPKQKLECPNCGE